MSNENQETVADIVAWIRRHASVYGYDLADRIEAAEKREVDSIHRAMVLIAGIEMEGSENPPRLWTALEDAYDALSDALGTDGDASADLEEAKAIGRHFVIKSYGNAAKMREALNEIQLVCYKAGITIGYDVACGIIKSKSRAALSAPPRNCDVGTSEEQAERFRSFCNGMRSDIEGMCASECPCIECSSMCHCMTKWSQMPYEEGETK